jgi:hypothetical protein
VTKQKRKDQRAEKRHAKQDRRIASASFSRKLERAGEHIEDLRVACDEWLGTDAYRVVREIEPETGYTAHRVKIKEPPPARLGLLVGDAVHNLRSALDHIALELAVSKHRPGRVPATIEESSEFPIFPLVMKNGRSGSDAFNATTNKGDPARQSGLFKLRGVESKAVAVIEGKQPYHRGNAWADDPLWVIHELDRIDKHRRVHLTAYAIAGTELTVPGDQPINFLHIDHVGGYSGPVQDGTEVARYRSGNTKVEVNVTREIALPQGGPAENEVVGATLQRLRNYVRDEIVPLLTPFL